MERPSLGCLSSFCLVLDTRTQTVLSQTALMASWPTTHVSIPALFEPAISTTTHCGMHVIRLVTVLAADGPQERKERKEKESFQ